LEHKFADSLPSIENIQDIVEQVLISSNYFATAKAYILYRDQRSRVRNDKKVVVDVEDSEANTANTDSEAPIDTAGENATNAESESAETAEPQPSEAAEAATDEPQVPVAE